MQWYMWNAVIVPIKEIFRCPGLFRLNKPSNNSINIRIRLGKIWTKYIVVFPRWQGYFATDLTKISEMCQMLETKMASEEV